MLKKGDCDSQRSELNNLKNKDREGTREAAAESASLMIEVELLMRRPNGCMFR